MRWRDQQESQNVEDARGDAGGGLSFPSGGAARGGIGIIGFLILLGLSLFFGIDPRTIFQGTSGPATEEEHFPGIRLPQSQTDQTGVPVPRTSDHQVQSPQTTSEDDRERFVSVVLRDTEDVWTDLFKQYGTTYTDPKLVLFDGSIRSACGNALSAMGPFYCPEDEKVYLDLSFFRELKDRFHAPGDFAQAYVIAHERSGITYRSFSASPIRSRRRDRARARKRRACFRFAWNYKPTALPGFGRTMPKSARTSSSLVISMRC
jgi:uncharacterized protein